MASLKKRLLEQLVHILPTDATSPILAGPLAGLRMRANFSMRPQFLLGAYEMHVARALRANLGKSQIAYDVGANVGYLTLVMSRAVGPTGSVYAFEPSPHAFRSLESNSQLNPKCTFDALQLALADRVGEQPFSDFDYDLVARLGDYSAKYSDARVVKVQVETIDHLIDQGRIRPPDFAKIDVEGAELLVLAGMDRTLRERGPVLVIEVHGLEIEHDVRSRLRDLGYEIEVLTDGDPKQILCRRQ
jgi:FkbM family methyltransferase